MEKSSEKKILELENEDQAKSLLYFLAKEISRHLKDVWQIWHDIERICLKWNLPKPDLPDPNEWVET
jgi:hypothetical protein